jgi:hypothetical protein
MLDERIENNTTFERFFRRTAGSNIWLLLKLELLLLLLKLELLIVELLVVELRELRRWSNNVERHVKLTK